MINYVPFSLHCTLMAHWLHTGKTCWGRGEVWSLTSGEAWWIIIHVCQCHSHRRGAREAAHLSHHVLGLDDQKVLVSCLSVHVWKSCSDDPCKWRPNFTFPYFLNKDTCPAVNTKCSLITSFSTLGSSWLTCFTLTETCKYMQTSTGGDIPSEHDEITTSPGR